MKNDVRLEITEILVLWVLNLRSLWISLQDFFLILVLFWFLLAAFVFIFNFFFWLFSHNKFHLDAVGYLIFACTRRETDCERERETQWYLWEMGFVRRSINSELHSAIYPRDALNVGLQNRTEPQWALRLRQRLRLWLRPQLRPESTATEAQVQVNVGASAPVRRLGRKRAHACCRRQCLCRQLHGHLLKCV